MGEVVEITTQERADQLFELVKIPIHMYFKSELYMKEHRLFEIETEEGLVIFAVFDPDSLLEICVSTHNNSPNEKAVNAIQKWARKHNINYWPSNKYPYCYTKFEDVPGYDEEL